MRTIYVYIMADRNQKLRVGYTDDLRRDLASQNRGKKLYSERLVYYETLPNVREALNRFAALRQLSSQAQAGLVAAFNPHWDDLSGLWRAAG